MIKYIQNHAFSVRKRPLKQSTEIALKYFCLCSVVNSSSVNIAFFLHNVTITLAVIGLIELVLRILGFTSRRNIDLYVKYYMLYNQFV